MTQEELKIQQLQMEIAELKSKLDLYKHDPLTGLLMRRDFDAKLREIWNSQENFFLCLVDVNGLHNVNREHGYDAGDRLIKRVAYDLVEKFSGIPFRIGGDEFAIICLQDKKVEIETTIIRCAYKTEVDNLDDLVKLADNRLIEAKKELYKDEDDRRRECQV